ncbi:MULTISPECIES: hypothetical protein [unclassified Bradyrhizobium]|uniref:hypothetical protein n=1 Tax=unclassified Bradyrhizobium TaxID=2631580 RepID=UPI001BAB4646|nr:MULTISPECIES: hypothetical protein [unclassified Bradyrhizobium]MBR1229051.1 hypothetical protein [Bradyrhizobium sp. AUGA SZCCT0176]MBR1299014.1 hypothetical protein [Bradyrhizobium sp. AUGA SZCCT0042]
MSTSALNEAIHQNTAGNSDGYPLGVPSSWGWYKGALVANDDPPSDFSAVTAWGVIYPQTGVPLSPSPSDDTVQIANFRTYLHLTNGNWVLVQNQSTQGIQGAHYYADYAGGDATVPWSLQKLSDGSAIVDAPTSGYNDHFWPLGRGTYTPGTVDGIYVVADMKTNDPSANLVAQLGADWWRNSSAGYVNDFSNNPLAGNNNWTKLTTEYQQLYFTTLTAAELTADPPPGLEPGGSTTPTTPTNPTTPENLAPSVTQASASPGTGIEHVGDTITLTLRFSETVNVIGTPTLSLNDGAKAAYFGGSGTNTLTFKTTVATTHTDTSALAITGVNIPTGSSIKDAGGLAANLSGAVKTFTGLQVDVDPISPTSPTSPTNPTSPTSPSSVAPVLTVVDPTLTVAGRGGTVGLGVKVSTTDPNDKVTVNIRGLASYETITDGLGHTFSGRNITLTKEQVDSGLTLHNYYRGSRDPVDTITLTATAKDPVTGAVTTSSTKWMTLSDAPSTTTTSATTPTTTTPQTPSVMAPATATTSPVTSTLTASAPQSITVTAAPPATTTATAPATSTTTASLANQSFALLNQYMAASPGRVDSGQIVSAISNGTTWGQESFLTRPPAS